MLHPNTRIVSSGGTPLDDPDSLKIHRAIVSLAEKKRPNALLIPTASSDNPDINERFDKTYGKKLRCNTDVLHMKHRTPSKRELSEKIAAADIIYVGGGNTLMMMRRWRKLGVDKLLLRAHRRGCVLAGSSAGALCWYSFGHSDSMWYYNPDNWEYVRVRGLGILPATACPHVHAEGRMASFEQMIRLRGGIGIAMDDRSAVLYRGNEYQVICSDGTAGVYHICKHRQNFFNRPLQPKGSFRPVDELFAI